MWAFDPKPYIIAPEARGPAPLLVVKRVPDSRSDWRAASSYWFYGYLPMLMLWMVWTGEAIHVHLMNDLDCYCKWRGMILSNWTGKPVVKTENVVQQVSEGLKTMDSMAPPAGTWRLERLSFRPKLLNDRANIDVPKYSTITRSNYQWWLS